MQAPILLRLLLQSCGPHPWAGDHRSSTIGQVAFATEAHAARCFISSAFSRLL